MITLDARSKRFKELQQKLRELHYSTHLGNVARSLAILETLPEVRGPLFLEHSLLHIAHDCIEFISDRKGTTYELSLQTMYVVQDRKGRDYGEDVDGLKNLRRRGQSGVIARMGDKLTRLETLTKPGREAAVTDESVEDTAIDFANYCLLLIILDEDQRGMYP